MELLSEEECRSAVGRALGGDHFVLEGMNEDDAGDSPSCGFMARHVRFVARVITADGGPEEVRMFIKVPPKSEAHRRLLQEMEHFDKELTMYETVVPVMSGVLPAGMKLPLPRCLLTRRGAPPGLSDLIALEDLSREGYRLWDKMKPFDLPHCLVALRALARFHAASLLVQRSAQSAGKGDNGNYVDGTFRVARDRILSVEGEIGRMWAETSVQTIATASAGLWPERRFVEEGRMLERLREAWREMAGMATPSRRHVNVVCHGDLWPNNLMFRYEGGGEQPADDAVLVDLQLVRFAPPATDILMLLHTCTTRAFREEHARRLLLAYHGQLEEVVGSAALGELLPLGKLLQSVEEHALFGKMVSAAWNSVTIGVKEAVPAAGEGGEPPDFATGVLRNRGEGVLADAKENEIFRTRISECYEECLQHLGLWE